MIYFTPSILWFSSVGARIFESDPPNCLRWGVEFLGNRVEHGFEFKSRNGKTVFRQYEYIEGFLAPVGFALKPLLYNFDVNWGDDLQKALDEA